MCGQHADLWQDVWDSKRAFGFQLVVVCLPHPLACLVPRRAWSFAVPGLACLVPGMPGPSPCLASLALAAVHSTLLFIIAGHRQIIDCEWPTFLTALPAHLCARCLQSIYSLEAAYTDIAPHLARFPRLAGCFPISWTPNSCGM